MNSSPTEQTDELIPVQIAFQGGGAKLCALMAVGQALQDAHGKSIEIKRVSGTSAGSIVAALVASKKPIDQIRKELIAGHGERMVKAYTLKWPRLLSLWMIATGRPLRSQKQLRDWLDSIFDTKELQIGAISKESKIGLIIPSTDLAEAKAIPEAQVKDVKLAILNSTNIPFFFGAWKTPSGRYDGGLCENLPVDLLREEIEEYSENIIAISFEPLTGRSPSGTLSFALSLLDSAISTAERKTRLSLHPANIHYIDTSIGTFDFEDAFRSGLNDKYELAYIRATQWIANWVRFKKDGKRQLKVDPWLEENPTAQFLLRQVGKVYRDIEQKKLIRYLSCRFSIYCNSLRQPGDPWHDVPDTAEVQFVFHTERDSVASLRMGLFNIDSGSLFVERTASIQLFGPNGKHRIIETPVRCEDDDLRSRSLCLFFDPPLEPGTGPYTLNFIENAQRLMQDLVKKGEDIIAYVPLRGSGPVGKVEYIFGYPRQFNISVEGHCRPGLGLRMHALSKEEATPQSVLLPDMEFVGWVAEEVPLDSEWKLNIVKRQATT